MWALRRASNPLKFRGLSVGTSRSCCAKSEIVSSYVEGKAVTVNSPQPVSQSPRFHQSTNVGSKFYLEKRGFASQAGAENSGLDDDLEDGFSELETPANANESTVNALAGNEDQLISEPELSDDDNDDIGEPAQNALELSDNETDSVVKSSPRKRATTELFNAIVSAPDVSVQSVLDKWVAEGKDLDRLEISNAIINLRKRRMFGRALQLSEWFEANKPQEFVERDYASRLDLIAKVRGLHKAEVYINKIPKSFKGEVIYRTLLANCVSANNAKKAVEVFNKMKDLELPITLFSYNQLLLLYKRHDKKKIADVLLLMEKENVKPSLFTYILLIDTKGQSNDIAGMEQIAETMKAEGIEPDIKTQAIMARHYVSGGLKEKAEIVLKEMEGGNLEEHRWACQFMLPLYGTLGKADEVSRLWKFCKKSPRLDECMAAIEAWGQLKKIPEAEAVFELMSKTWKKLSAKHYSALLKVYANNKMLSKGKDLIKQMGDSGCRIGPLTWDALIKLYVEAGEVEKADSILNKAVQQNQMKPMFSSYMIIMEKYASKGDIHNAEKMFHRMRQAGYQARSKQFQTLIQAYINAKAPCYGMRERLKADGLFANKAMAAQLSQVDAFKRTVVSDLLD
uniref:PROP1-like PPR domain-containing protein n=1 Tax=Populus davidiana TaxID=266767 RepID=A0A6M2E9R9_9ROSI